MGKPCVSAGMQAWEWVALFCCVASCLWGVAPGYWMALLCVLNVKNGLGILFWGRGEMNAKTLTGISSG